MNKASQLRQYQKEAIASIRREHKAGSRKQLVCLPTGSGKTVILASLIKEINQKTLVIAHRNELIQQLFNEIRKRWPEVTVGICKADVVEMDCKVVIGSIQSCSNNKKLEQLKKRGFGILVIDEAHHAVASSYKKLIDKLGFKSGNKLLVGFTATPDRKGILKVFEKITYSLTIKEMIKKGFLVNVQARRIDTAVSLDDVPMRNDDFQPQALATAINIESRNALIIKKFIEHTSQRKALAFCVNVQHCIDLAAMFNAANVPSKAIYGAMDEKQRKNILADFSTGTVQVVTSCNVLTEGFDEPSINCIIMARPTKSKTLFVQCVGRGLRTAKDKTDCMLLDFSDSYHDLNSIMSLEKALGTTIDKQPNQESTIDRMLAGPQQDMRSVRVHEISDEKYDIFDSNVRNAEYIWVPIGEGEFSLIDDNGNEIVLLPYDDNYAADIYFKNSDKQALLKERHSFDEAKKLCEQYAQENLSLKYANKNGSYFRNASKVMVTQRQKDLLRAMGKYVYNGMTKATAIMMIKIEVAHANKRKRLSNFGPPTEAQRIFLERAGAFDNRLTKHTATRLISKLKQKSGTSDPMIIGLLDNLMKKLTECELRNF